MALESLCQVSPTQRHLLEKTPPSGGGTVLNRGRVVFLTHLTEGDRGVQGIVDSFRQHLESVNRAAAAAKAEEGLMPINQVSGLAY